MIDYLSDTVTKPTPEMRQACFEAMVGDDVYGEDPTANRLEALAAEMLGKEAACFVPSGTMANLTAILAHCPRGYELIVGDESDIYNYQAGGVSFVGGVAFHPVPTQADGTLSLVDLEEAIRDPDDYQCARAGLIAIENPCCRVGGRVLSFDYLERLRAFADRHRLPIHMDGARIFNAAIALDRPPSAVAGYADSVQFCLSKNLGAPVGSMVVGNKRFVADVRRLRKMLGGGMRQIGVIAAAGIVALETMVDRLREDHVRARKLAEGIAGLPGIQCQLDTVETNMVFFSVTDVRFTTQTFLKALGEQGVRMGELGHGRIRAVIHFEHDDAMIEQTVAVFENLLNPVPAETR